MGRYSYLWVLPALVYIAAGGTTLKPIEPIEPVLIEIRSHQHIYRGAADGRLAAQQPLVPPKTEGQDLNPMKSGVMVGLLFRSPLPEHDSYVRIPLRERVKPGTELKLALASCRYVSDFD